MVPDGLMNWLQTMVLTLDSNLDVRYANEAAESCFGSSVHKQNYSQLFLRFQFSELDSEKLRECLKKGGSFHQAESELVLLDGESIEVDIIVNRVEQKSEPFILLEIYPKGHVQKIESEFRLLDQNRLTNNIIRNLAHEIKNPLGGLRGAAQLLQQEIQGEALKTKKEFKQELEEYTQVIITEADRLKALVDRMLTPHHVTEKKWMNIHLIIEQVLELISINLASNIQLKKDYDPSLPQLYLCSDQIYQLLLNLIQNSIDAMPEGGDLTVRSRAKHQHAIGRHQHKLVAQIDILDTGVGVNAEISDSIFYPTISGKNSTGLGLGIAQSLAQSHQGIIEFVSCPGNTIFSLFLPAQPVIKEYE